MSIAKSSSPSSLSRDDAHAKAATVHAAAAAAAAPEAVALALAHDEAAAVTVAAAAAPGDAADLSHTEVHAAAALEIADENAGSAPDVVPLAPPPALDDDAAAAALDTAAVADHKGSDDADDRSEPNPLVEKVVLRNNNQSQDPMPRLRVDHNNLENNTDCYCFLPRLSGHDDWSSLDSLSQSGFVVVGIGCVDAVDGGGRSTPTRLGQWQRSNRWRCRRWLRW